MTQYEVSTFITPKGWPFSKEHHTQWATTRFNTLSDARKHFDQLSSELGQKVRDGVHGGARIDMFERPWYFFPWHQIAHAKAEEAES